MASLAAGRAAVPVHGLIEIDVTDTRRRLRELDRDLSFTAFVIASVARTAARHPEVHAYRDWRGRLVTVAGVDATVIVEVRDGDELFPLAALVTDAHSRSVADITRQIRGLQAESSGTSSMRHLDRVPRPFFAIPGLLRTMFWLLGHTAWGRDRTGTVGVSAVGMFGDRGGFGLAAPTLYSLGVLVGGMSRKPRVIDGHIVEREVLDLTIMVDHNLVDGAPTARFVTELANAIESGAVLATEHEARSSDRKGQSPE